MYHLIDPRTDEVFYVGKGVRDRIEAHEKEAKSGSDHQKCVVIREIWASGHSVKRKIAKRFSEEAAAYAYEASEIERIGRCKLTNIMPGGGAPRQSAVIKSRLTPEGAAKWLIGYIATALYFKAKGEDVGPTLQSIYDQLIQTSKGLIDRFGFEFFAEELTHYGIKAIDARAH